MKEGLALSSIPNGVRWNDWHPILDCFFDYEFRFGPFSLFVDPTPEEVKFLMGDRETYRGS